MSKTFAVMKTNVTNFVQDTSSNMKTLAGVFINDAYQSVARRNLFESIIDHDYTFDTVISQSEYSLPSDFEEELFLANIATGCKLVRYTQKDWWEKRYSAYLNDSITAGTPDRYMILYDQDKLKIDPAPTKAETYAMPYKKRVTDLSGDSDVCTIKDIEMYLEAYAISMAFSYQKQFQKADYWMNKAEFELNNLIESQNSRNNQYGRILGASYDINNSEVNGANSYGL